jgi:PAS domain S-box-containing protein
VGQDVTSTIHQADLEKTLKEREIQFRLLVENMHEGFVMRDATGVITYVNKGFCNMLGKAAEAVMGTTIDQYLCESSLSLFQTETEKRKQGKGNVYELCFLNQQKQPITVIVAGAPLLDSQRNYRGSFAVITDITERKNIENQLRETETRYHQMFEQNTAVKLVIDSDTGRIVDANPAAAAFYQYDRETLKTMRITDITPLPMEEAYPKFQLALSEKRTRFRFQHRLANGEIRDVDIFVGPVELEGKTLLYTIIYDVTERVKVEAVLHYIQERWNSFVKNIPVPMFLKDKEGRILYVNPAFEKQFEFHMSDWHGKNDFDLWPKAVAEKFRQDDREVLQEGKPRVMEETLSYKGEDRFWLTYKFPFVDSSGQHFLAGMTFDMTERRTVMNRALELALERERVRILSGFIEAASHEFKTPISVIQTNLYLLEKQVAPEKQKQYIQRIQDQADNLLRLVEGLVRMTELDSSVSLNRQTIDIHMLLEVVIARAASIGGRCTVTRRFGAAPATVQADAEWLGEALLEILNNAFRFTPETGEIILTTRQDGEFLKVDIQDSGIGIAPEAQPHLFERFFRADYAHSTRGFGLGLSIAKKIIELHGGEIRVTSKPGKGSIFTVVLPQSGGL